MEAHNINSEWKKNPEQYFEPSDWTAMINTAWKLKMIQEPDLEWHKKQAKTLKVTSSKIFQKPTQNITMEVFDIDRAKWIQI